ncbi:MAG: hypothetical protein H0T46_19290 [Deltaproteobacteria bacterium]|nr:hypothetical protein [Deltaproteobacteria bacterium]
MPSPVVAPAMVPMSQRALTVTVERTPERLAAHTAAWEELVANAADPNPFYEPYALLAALRLLPDAKDVEVVLVWASNPLPRQPRFLVGLFPLVHRRYKGLPLPTLSTWKHGYQYLGTPLVRHDCAAVRRLHEPGAPAWVDSGAAAEHPMINHLWRDRAGIETLVTSTGRSSGALAVAAFPLARLARTAVKRLKPTKP